MKRLNRNLLRLTKTFNIIKWMLIIIALVILFHEVVAFIYSFFPWVLMPPSPAPTPSGQMVLQEVEMKAIVSLTPSIRLEIDERDEMETLSKAIVLSNPKRKCLCGNTEGLYMTSNKDKEGNVYVNVKCPKCGARSKLGLYKSGGFFWHDFEKYVPKAEPEDNGSSTAMRR